MVSDSCEVTVEIDPGDKDPYELLKKLRSGLEEGSAAVLRNGYLKSISAGNELSR